MVICFKYILELRDELEKRVIDEISKLCLLCIMQNVCVCMSRCMCIFLCGGGVSLTVYVHACENFVCARAQVHECKITLLIENKATRSPEISRHQVQKLTPPTKIRRRKTLNYIYFLYSQNFVFLETKIITRE